MNTSYSVTVSFSIYWSCILVGRSRCCSACDDVWLVLLIHLNAKAKLISTQASGGEGLLVISIIVISPSLIERYILGSSGSGYCTELAYRPIHWEWIRRKYWRYKPDPWGDYGDMTKKLHIPLTRSTICSPWSSLATLWLKYDKRRSWHWLRETGWYHDLLPLWLSPWIWYPRFPCYFMGEIWEKAQPWLIGKWRVWIDS